MKFRRALHIIIALPLFMVMVWLFAVPSDLIKERVEESVSQSGVANIEASISGFRKGIFFSLHADGVELKIDRAPALNITGLTFNPDVGRLLNGDLAFLIRGKIGDGDVKGRVKLPASGKINIDNAELEAIPFLKRFGVRIYGHLFSDINIKNNIVKVLFKVPDLNIDDSSSVIPLLNTFHRLQGGLTVKDNGISVDSISLEGDKGYARLKGDIMDGGMKMALELMPDEDKLNTLESMLIGKYIVSPGYYVVPVEGPLSNPSR